MQRNVPAMKAVWERLEAWFGANAPAGYGDLRAGASVDTVAAAEDAMGLRLPEDVKASYRIHDGQDREPGLIGGEGWRLLPLQEAVKAWHRWSGANSALAHRVPLAWNSAGDFVFLNAAADPGGPCSLMIQRADSAEADPLAPSFAAWLEGFAAELEDGVFVYSEEHGEVMLADDVD